MAKRRPTAEIVRLNRALNRLELATALEMSGGEDEAALAKLLRSEGDSRRITIFKLAQDIGVPARRVVECYRDMKRLEGIVAVADRLPDVMAGVVADAESKSVTCPSCGGSGEIVVQGDLRDENGKSLETKMCIPCEGRGKIVKSGDAVARKQVLEIMELTGKSPIWAPGSNILIPGESLEDTLRGVRQRKEAAQNGTDRVAPTIIGDEQAPR